MIFINITCNNLFLQIIYGECFFKKEIGIFSNFWPFNSSLGIQTTWIFEIQISPIQIFENPGTLIYGYNSQQSTLILDHACPDYAADISVNNVCFVRWVLWVDACSSKSW